MLINLRVNSVIMSDEGFAWKRWTPGQHFLFFLLGRDGQRVCVCYSTCVCVCVCVKHKYDCALQIHYYFG